MGKSSPSGDSTKGPHPTKGPWYRDGLQFECSQCGDCCSGDPGYVWVAENEIAAMSDQLGLEIDAFEKTFVRQVGRDKSLIEYPDGDCSLLDPQTRKCSVYDSRPTQCRTWPFWDSNLKNRKAWRATCEVCPGAGTGQIHTFADIETSRKRKSV